MKRRHYIALTILLAGLAVSGWMLLHPLQLPLEECGDHYRRYAGNPHVSVAFIRDFPINDTLCLDVTTLTAQDSTGWEQLKKDFVIPQIPPEIMSNMENSGNHVFLRLVPRNEPQQPMDTINYDNNEVLAMDFFSYTVAIFHTSNDYENIAVLNHNYSQPKLKFNQ